MIGSWITEFDVAVDLMVPTEVSGLGTRKSRGVQAPPHDRYSMRRTRGLEGALVSYAAQKITSFEPNDPRAFYAKVAAPAALLVAKLHKIKDRAGQTQGRRDDKDAHDVYRILRSIETAVLVSEFQLLRREKLSSAVTIEAFEILQNFFGSRHAAGSMMAGRAEEAIGDPEQVALAASILATDLVVELTAN